MSSMTTSDVAKVLEVGDDEVRRLVREGKLITSQKKGKRPLSFHPVDVKRLKYLRDCLEFNAAKPDIVWVLQACLYLADRVRFSGFEPDFVVGIAYGGLIPAAFISRFLKKPLMSIYPPFENLSFSDIGEEGDILLVDDVADSGKTLQKTNDLFKAAGFTVKSATLHVKPKSIVTPDFYVSCINEWVFYPWELREGDQNE